MFLVLYFLPQMMEYERSFIRKMRSLFQYFDSDGDGRITSADLQDGLLRLRAYREDAASPDVSERFFCDEEELLRSLMRLSL